MTAAAAMTGPRRPGGRACGRAIGAPGPGPGWPVRLWAGWSAAVTGAEPPAEAVSAGSGPGTGANWPRPVRPSAIAISPAAHRQASGVKAVRSASAAAARVIAAAGSRPCAAWPRSMPAVPPAAAATSSPDSRGASGRRSPSRLATVRGSSSAAAPCAGSDTITRNAARAALACSNDPPATPIPSPHPRTSEKDSRSQHNPRAQDKAAPGHPAGAMTPFRCPGSRLWSSPADRPAAGGSGLASPSAATELDDQRAMAENGRKAVPDSAVRASWSKCAQSMWSRPVAAGAGCPGVGLRAGAGGRWAAGRPVRRVPGMRAARLRVPCRRRRGCR